MISEKRINQIITEEISKTDVENIVSRKLDSNDFKKSVKEIVADVIEDLYRTLWNRSSTWRGGITR